MFDQTQIREHMDVLDNAGWHLGTVDHLDNGRIKLTKSDPAAGGQHHYLDLNQADRVEGDALHLKISGEEARANWG